MDAKNSIQLYSFQQKDFRIISIKDESWFVLVDVLNILGLKESHNIINALDEDEKIKITSSDFVHLKNKGTKLNSKIRSLWLINEPGLYKCIFRSNKPEAKKFTNWVTKEVLPQLRKTGSYSLPARKRKNVITQAEKIDRKMVVSALELLTMLDEVQIKHKELKKSIIEKLESELKE